MSPSGFKIDTKKKQQGSSEAIQIGIDEQIFLFQNTGGISKYFAHLLSTPYPDSGCIVKPLFHQHRNHHLLSAGVGTYDPERGPKDYLPAYTETAEPLKTDCRIVHTTYYHGSPIRFMNQIHVCSLYDMIPECHPELFPHGNPHANKAAWFERCDAIISISHSAADELRAISPHLDAKIKVIHLGFQRNEGLVAKANKAGQEIGWPLYDYYLYVGARRGYKNSLMLLKAYLGSTAAKQGIHLVFAGGGSPVESEVNLIRAAGMESMVHFFRPTDLDMYLLYTYATAVLVSSLAEGFSLPLVEALGFDAPLICSEIPVHHEVAGQFSHLISPLDRRTWQEVLSEPQAMRRPSRYLHAKYESRLEYFSMDRMVKEHHDFYQALGT